MRALRAALSRLPGAGRVAQTVGVNSVPAAGFFGDGWSIGTMLALYWLETVLVIALISLRVLLHRRLTRKAGHWNVEVTATTRTGGRVSRRQFRTTHLVGFLTVMIPFTLGHGLFLVLILLVALPQQAGAEAARLSLADLRLGLVALAVMLALGLLLDLVGLRDRPFRWIERLTGRAQGRIFVTHLTILAGMFGLAASGGPEILVGAFVVLKALVDLGGLVPEKEPPLEAPSRLRWLDRLGARGGKSFSDHYRDAELERRRKCEENERVLERLPA